VRMSGQCDPADQVIIIEINVKHPSSARQKYFFIVQMPFAGDLTEAAHGLT